MKYRNNENGYALLMVIMLVLLFTTLGMGLLAMNINASKQFNIKEEQVQVRHQAEMGILQYKAEVKSFVSANSNKSDLSCNDFPNEISESTNEINGSYTVKKLTENNNIEGKKCIENENEIIIFVLSTGVSNNSNIIKEIEAQIRLYKSGTTDSNNEQPSNGVEENESENTEVYNGNFTINRGGYTPTKKNFIINGNLIAETGNNKDINLTVYGNLEISGSIDINNHACVIVGGNLKVNTLEKIKADTKIIVFGDAYVNSHNGAPSGEIFVLGKDIYNSLSSILSDNDNLPSESECPHINSIEKPINWMVDPLVNPDYIT